MCLISLLSYYIFWKIIPTLSVLETGILLFYFFLAFAAFSIVDRNNTAAFGTGIFSFLLFHENSKTILFDKKAVLYKACFIPLIIASFKVFDKLTGKSGTFKTAGQGFIFGAVLYFAFAAMPLFSLITIQAPLTSFFVVTVLVTNLAVHSAWGKHTYINFFRHFHRCPPLLRLPALLTQT